MNKKIISRMTKIFKRLGIQEREGKILIVLNEYGDGLKQKDICYHGYMYQPEASVGLQNLINKKWVTIVDRVTPESKGRPFSIYALSKPFVQIIDEIQERIANEYESIVFDIERLKKIA